MVNTIVDGTLRQTNLTNESSEYLAKREELRLAEIELMRQRERVAELRRLSGGDSTFKYDLGSEDREGHQDSTVSVFTRDADGTLRHFYSAHPRMAPDIPERGIDLLASIWHFMDLTPQGRGNGYTSLDYGTKVQAASK